MLVPSLPLSLFSLLPVVLASHDPSTVPPPLDVISTGPYDWPSLTNSPLSASYQCHTGRPGFAPTAYTLRLAVSSLESRGDGCNPLATPLCSLLGVEEWARVSFCRVDSEGEGEDDGENDEGDDEEEGPGCTVLAEVARVFVDRCFRRGLAGGFVRIEEGVWEGNIMALWADFTDRPPVPSPTN